MLAPTIADARKKSKRQPAVDRYASIVIDAESGYVLSAKNPDKQLYPASLTKMMTLYMTFSAINNGTLRKNQRLSVSRHAAAQEPSDLGLQPGSSIRVEDAILGLVTKSANDAAVVLAEGIGGSESSFARAMTTKAHELGMTNTRFLNASGLFNSSQVSTARDMATLAVALMRDFPSEYRYFSTPRFTWAGRTFENHNRLMRTYRGMDGLKTGYVRQSGFNLVASAVRDNHRLIGVVFGGTTATRRNVQMASLLDQSFTLRSTPAIAAQIEKTRAQKQFASALKAPARYESATMATPIAAADTSAPRFDSMGLSVDTEDTSSEEGDADEGIVVTPPKSSVQYKTAAALPRPVGNWLIQIGTFNSQKNSMAALQTARKKLPPSLVQGAQMVVVPLATNRGTIYRARIVGLTQMSADKACQVLREHCIIISMQ